MNTSLNIIVWVKVSDLGSINDLLNGVGVEDLGRHDRREIYVNQPGLIVSNGQVVIAITTTYNEFNLLTRYYELV